MSRRSTRATILSILQRDTSDCARASAKSGPIEAYVPLKEGGHAFNVPTSPKAARLKGVKRLGFGLSHLGSGLWRRVAQSASAQVFDGPSQLFNLAL